MGDGWWFNGRSFHRAHWLRLYICGDRDVDECMTYSVSRGLARAFGTSPELWVNLDRAWQDHIARIGKMVGG